MLIIIIIIVIILIYFFLNDKQEKYNDLANNPSLNKGIFHKYELLFEHWRNKGLLIEEVSKSEVRMSFDFDIEQYVVNTEIRVHYQASQKLQFIVQLNLVKPVNRYIKTKSFFYDANASEKQLIIASDDEIGRFFKNTLEGL